MGIIRIIKPGLFIYECVRIILLAFTLVFLLPVDSAIPWMALAAPGALFPLMALFLWIDTERYGNFLPLFIAGKCIGFFAFLGWSVISGRFTIIQWAAGVNPVARLIFQAGDLFAIAAALLILRHTQNMQKIMEDEQ